MKQTKDYTILAVGIVILLAVIASSCSVTRYHHESVNLKEGGEISKYQMKCKLVAVRPSKMGYKHTFLREPRQFDKQDTIVRFYNLRLKDVDSCFYITKTRLEK